MQIEFSKALYDPRWYDFETGAAVDEPAGAGAFLKIRPYPASASQSIYDPEKGVVYDGKELCKRFKFCLVDWRGVTGGDGKALACSDEIKQAVFDFNLGGIVPMVTRIIQQLDGYLRGLEKN